jgi:putative copper export protein
MVADVVHLICAMGWTGGLFCLAQVLRRGAADTSDLARVPAKWTPVRRQEHAQIKQSRACSDSEGTEHALGIVLSRFSRVGYWLVALLLISGCVNALVLVPRPDSLVTSDYGRVLLVKIGLALIMVAFALYNRVALAAHAVTSTAGAHALWRSVLAEQGVGLLVLATVALLGTIHPVP